ncbi:LysR family transcriptional regulator [Microbacterium hatanonis]|uniref:LysR family transcriptional regulator n=1 Tax=Microbacterium hatanonis TaxID=404366 RepID=A0A5C8HYU0_9MICO|nr:LysR family transcriptional regulator [Microbacterium hatanonis]TXK12028.1 LysR family transcriptional regulator [Microbacterium hatanonis]
MNDLLDLVALRSLVEIADAGTFTGAARALGVSQPAVSQHVRALETRFDATLVTRSSRRIVFTAAGERVLAEARRLLAVHDDVLRSLETLEETPIVVACIEHAVPSVLSSVLSELERSVPNRRVVVQVDNAEHIGAGLKAGLIDVAVVLGHDWDTPGNEIGRFALRWVTGRPLAIQDPRGVPLVVNREPCRIRQHALGLLARSGTPAHIAAESSSLEGVLAAVRAGLGTALLPMHVRSAAGLHERPDLPGAGEIAVRLVTRRGVDPAVGAAATVGARRAFAPSKSQVSA